MADNNNNSDQNNIRTDSHLPLLFANGYPTSLEKMSCENLELFIPFLVRCAKYGVQGDPNSCPVWWPNTVELKTPLEKPYNFSDKDWITKLRSIVEECYKYHKLPFLLKYSQSLCEHEPANLRYVTASESTTSLYSRRPKRLLLTFRNENMLYDKKKRMTLWKKDENRPEQDEIEATFDIMLCDNCDAEFYSEEAFSKHEKKCGINLAKVEHPIVENIVISDDDDEDEVMEAETEVVDGNGQADFMAYFFLKSAGSDEIPKRNNSLLERSFSPKKKRKPNQRTRNITKREKGKERLIPFSSPGGVVLTKKAIVNETYLNECMAEIEENCPAIPNTKIPPRSRQRFPVLPDTAVTKDMRQPRPYYWPKRTLRSVTKEVNFEFLNRSLIEATKPCAVAVTRFSPEEIRVYHEQLKQLREAKARAMAAECVDLISDSDEDSVILEPNQVVRPSGAYQDFLPHEGSQLFPLTSVPKFNFLPQAPFSNDTFSPFESNSTHHIYHHFSFSASTPIANFGLRKRTRENDNPDPRMENRSIRNWVKDVNGTINQASYIKRFEPLSESEA